MGNNPSRNDEQEPSYNNNNNIEKNNIEKNNNRKNNEKKVIAKKKEELKLPHNYEGIIQSSDSPINESSPEKLLEQLQAGVFLGGRKMKYWVKGNDNINCFMVFAKGLQITWSEEMKYWVFQNTETSEGQVTVAVLRNVCWLDVSGKLHTKNLTPGVKYEVEYVMKLEESSYGWQVPVNFKLTLPNGTQQEHKENLNPRPRDEWFRISVGEFEAPLENMGEVHFSLYEYQGGGWKKGLIIKGVSFEPKI